MLIKKIYSSFYITILVDIPVTHLKKLSYIILYILLKMLTTEILIEGENEMAIINS